jgi:hypothetical protein
MYNKTSISAGMKKRKDKKTNIHVRCTLEFKEELEALAEKQERSLSGQVVFLLKQAIKRGIKIIVLVIPVSMPP